MALKLPKLPQKQQVLGHLSGATEKIFVVLVVLYVIVSVSRSVMKNYNINQKIADLEYKLIELDNELAYLDSIIAYYKTNTFKELKAREELGLHFPGEIVLSVPLEEEDLQSDAAYLAIAPEKPAAKPLPNYERWWHYFFGG